MSCIRDTPPRDHGVPARWHRAASSRQPRRARTVVRLSTSRKVWGALRGLSSLWSSRLRGSSASCRTVFTTRLEGTGPQSRDPANDSALPCAASHWC
ncbi:hypothetical protein HBI56_150110 [Parastagonospora nodorum]|uniref:Uncharacterized protein n=1 Tax=Phaeosphaeria nodorum (strain SN15 / ATCC MYA-4574 / FGSC 10173) TaxID=321614 RepID=A0A7U2FF16_PHANO|nr:hypothetical protein HBH56_184410 [Parastagonospora nodorum]QRD04065.1 hypothetical protein JI435_420620 [Parastagonospora nodorum SN15]KAH3925981.1 hypothetical protein HBH54_173560 [Parastagonospora nodorum]KAH3944838.1 hypothetical protein HBH53_151370 [Parastagonospora nodorum]KAH3962514.1 hypothetical protein HBH52_225040 [Parastagonospora nodorum]